jgi:UTP--glucose-1-phosphate uridylyltransferase
MTGSAQQQAIDRMRAAGVPEPTTRTFADQHARLAAGERGVLPESAIEPVAALPDAEALPHDDAAARDALQQTVVIKLNGGLGTSMGMTSPKALLPVKDGRSFLDLTAEQVRDLRRRTGARLPLLLMHSFATREASLAALARHPDVAVEGVPQDFLQGRVPKIRQDDLAPVDWPADPDLEWAPPGHGDLYASLQADWVLDGLVEGGYRYAFVSNSDNLGATVDARILAWFAAEGLPFLMEVADRTAADRKGGHLARRPGGGLVLREIAQVPDADLDAFQDTGRHRYFNTNSLWLDLVALRDLLRARDGVLGLPMIVNRKTVDPTDPGSTPVIQLETAMGAAIDVVEGAAAVRVPRSRFAPVKTTDDLLVLRSDAYVLVDGGQVALAPGRSAPPTVQLDPAHFTLVADFDARFPAGPPSLIGCDRVVVRGDVTFGAGVTAVGDVLVEGPAVVPDGAELGADA